MIASAFRRIRDYVLRSLARFDENLVGHFLDVHAVLVHERVQRLGVIGVEFGQVDVVFRDGAGLQRRLSASDMLS